MNKLHYSVDIEGYNLKAEDSYILEGWIFSEDIPVEKLSVVTDQGQVLDVSVEWKEREDLKAVFPHGKIADKPGFSCRIPHVTQWMVQADTVSLQGILGEEVRCICTRTSEEIQQVVKEHSIFYQVDIVRLLGEDLEIQGWFFDQRECEEIQVLGRTDISVEHQLYRTRREDVRVNYSEYLERDRAIGFTIKIPRENIKDRKIRIRFISGSLWEEYSIDVYKLEREDTPASLLWDCLRPEKFRENKAYIREHGLGDFFRYVRNQMEGPYGSYHRWMKKQRITAGEAAKQKKEKFPFEPAISIIIPLYNTPLSFLKEALDSIVNQTYSKWQLCLADGSTGDEVEHFIKKEYTGDSRICYKRLEKNGGISQNTNAALAMARGEYVMLADHDDILERDALYYIVKNINENHQPDIIYTDEDKITMDGKRYFQPNFKPDYNPVMLECINYICHIFVVKRTIAEQIGGFSQEFDGAQDHDFILRCCEATDKSRICHIPRVLYHWRSHPNSTAADPESKKYAFLAGARAVENHLKRMNMPAKTELTESLGIYRVKPVIQGEPLVSILIPNKDHTVDLETCIASIVEKSTYKNYEILIIENNSICEETFSYYKQLPSRYPMCRVVIWEREFNYAAINNFGSGQAEGEYLLFLNNDVEVITPNWIEEMLGYCQRPQVGITGAKLFYPDDTVQHAGVIMGLGGVAAHIFSGIARYQPGYMGRAVVAQNLSAVTAACMMMKRTVFYQIEGFDEVFRVAYNDIDLCMKTLEAGYEVVFTPHAQLYHYESKSRGLEDTQEKQARFAGEIALFKEKWPRILEEGDPYYNPNLVKMRESVTPKE